MFTKHSILKRIFQPCDEYTPYEQFIRGLVAFLRDIGKEEVAVRIGAKIRSYWPGDENRKFYKFRAAFDYYKSRGNTTNTRSCEVEKSQFVDDSRVKRQLIRRRRKMEQTQEHGVEIYKLKTYICITYALHVYYMCTKSA